MSRTPTDTATPIDAVRNHGRGARSALVKRYAPGVILECFKFLKDKIEVTDAMHDVFVRFCYKIDEFNYRGEKELVAYLEKLARWECLNRIKKEEQNVLAYADELEAAEHLEGTTADGAVVVREIMAVIAQLSGRCRQVLRMTLKGIEIKEIAEYLGISETTISRHLGLARQKLANNPIIKEHRNGTKKTK